VSRTCYINKDKREMTLGGYKKYNVNIDILDFIIDLSIEKNNLEERISKAVDRIKGSLYIRDMIDDYENKKEYDEFIRDLLKDLGAWNE
jgi:hypothetical protein